MGQGHRSSSLSRRAAVQRLLGAAGTAAVFTALDVRAAEPHLAVTDPTAVAVGYVERAALADAKKFPSFMPGQSCENCLQLQGAAGAVYRPCSLFPGKLVASAGWCSGWTPEM